MPNQDEQDHVSSPEESETFAENISKTLKTLILSIGGVALVLAILILLPMLLTYLSEGDFRAPSETHPTDTANKNAYNH